MNNTSMILFGTLSSLLLIFACITLNASKFYTELEVLDGISNTLVVQPKIRLRDRSSYSLSQ